MDLADLACRAARGDQFAWTTLVRGASAIVLNVARSHRLDEADALDVCQSTWLSLATTLASLREPARLPGWLATTARRQALRTVARRRREIPAAAPDGAPGAWGHSPELRVLAAERSVAFWRAAEQGPPSHARLLRLLADRPELTQAELAAELGVAPGSVGPLRRRCFDRMRRRLLAEGFDAADLR